MSKHDGSKVAAVQSFCLVKGFWVLKEGGESPSDPQPQSDPSFLWCSAHSSNFFDTALVAWNIHRKQDPLWDTLAVQKGVSKVAFTRTFNRLKTVWPRIWGGFFPLDKDTWTHHSGFSHKSTISLRLYRVNSANPSNFSHRDLTTVSNQYEAVTVKSYTDFKLSTCHDLNDETPPQVCCLQKIEWKSEPHCNGWQRWNLLSWLLTEW